MWNLINIIVLGSGGVLPTKERLTSSFLIYDWNGYTILLDAGEGVQLRLSETPRSIHDIDAIAITHEHGDHINGLPGILQSMTVSRRKKPLLIIGPRSVIEFSREVLEATQTRLGFEIRYIEATDTKGIVLYEKGGDRLELEWAPSCHTRESMSYKLRWNLRPRLSKNLLEGLGVKPGPWINELIRKGLIQLNNRIIRLEDVAEEGYEATVVYTGDTAPCASVIELARKSALLIHEATYASDLEDEAITRGHSTAEHAALVAGEAEASYLLLFHISPRYRGNEARRLYLEARRYFRKVVLAWDLMHISLRPLRRGIKFE